MLWSFALLSNASRLCYHSDQGPQTEEEWNHFPFIDKTHWGYYCWPTWARWVEPVYLEWLCYAGFIYRDVGWQTHIHCLQYHKFHYMKFSLEKSLCWKFFIGPTSYENILTWKIVLSLWHNWLLHSMYTHGNKNVYAGSTATQSQVWALIVSM